MDTEVTAAADEFAPGRRVGAILADARAARGVELSDIARETRVPLRHLAAIEADAHDSLPALPYAIGFVKAFARAVGVDADAAGAQFRAETSKTAHVPAPPPMAPLDERRLPPRGLVTVSIIAVLVVIAGVVAWSAGVFDTVDHVAPSVVTSTGTVAALAPLTSTVVEKPATGPGAAVTDTAASSVAPPAPASMGGSLATQPAGAGAVVITASEDAWFRVSGLDTATNKVVTVKTGVLAKGERYIVPPTPGLKLWTGRAGALQLTVDGRAVPPLGGRAETVKNVSLDPAALRARIAGPTVGIPAQ